MANLGQLQSFCRGINHLSPARCNFNQRDKSRAEGELELGFALDLVFFPFISSSAPVGGTGEKLEQENAWGFLMPRLWMGRERPESPEMNPSYSTRRAGFLKQRGFFSNPPLCAAGGWKSHLCELCRIRSGNLGVGRALQRTQTPENPELRRCHIPSSFGTHGGAFEKRHFWEQRWALSLFLRPAARGPWAGLGGSRPQGAALQPQPRRCPLPGPRVTPPQVTPCPRRSQPTTARESCTRSARIPLPAALIRCSAAGGGGSRSQTRSRTRLGMRGSASA